MDMSFMVNGSYPAHYESRLTLKNGQKVFLRPILPADESLILDLFHKLSSDSLYLRFLRPLGSLPEDLLFRLTHIDYHKNFALVAVVAEDGRDAIIAVARFGYDPEEKVTDFAIVIRDDWQRQGLGKFMLRKLYEIGKIHGVSRFVSIIDPTNRGIKQILRRLGYTVKYSYPSGSTQVEVLA